MNEIFLSYKRSDDPGYVARLADSLEQAFGEGTVYRDVDSESAGGNWKMSITQNVMGAQIVLAVIGPEWQELMGPGSPGERDWVRYELNQANDFGKPVIPVVLAHAGFDHARDLGDLAWLKDLQFFNLADGQGRWETDIQRLAGEIESKTALKIRTSREDGPPVVKQKSVGDESPNISAGGDVIISSGKGKGFLERLLRRSD